MKSTKTHSYQPKYDGVNVDAKHVEEEPVTHLGFFHQNADGLSSDEAETHSKQVHPHPGARYDH